MDCSSAAPMLHLYLDGELGRAEVAELERHLDDCPACTRELMHLDELRRAVRSGAPRYRAPASLRRSLESASRRNAPARRPRPQWLALAASVLAAALVSFATVHWFKGSGGPDAPGELVAHDLFASHLRALAAASAVDVVSEDRHTVKPWFEGRIGVAPPVRDFRERGFELLGGRIDYVGGERVAAVVYRHGKHLVDVYFLGGNVPAPTNTSRQGYEIVGTRIQGQPAWIVSDMDATELGAFARLLETP